MEVHWLEQVESEVPIGNDWLSASEVARHDGMRYPKRRNDWRLGRWTAKLAVAEYLQPVHSPSQLCQYEIRSAASGAPKVFFANEPSPVTISISHRAGVATCAVAPPGVQLGCDLETIEPRSDGFIADYFTADEQTLVSRASASDLNRLVALFWSAKESALKALGTGLRLDTRCLNVCSAEDSFQTGFGILRDGKLPLVAPQNICLRSWHRLYVVHNGGQLFHGWWFQSDGLVRTVVGVPSPTPPILLNLTPFFASQVAGNGREPFLTKAEPELQLVPPLRH